MRPMYMEPVAVETKPLICLRDLSNYRERSVPDSPSQVKAAQLTCMSPVTMLRPSSNGSTTSVKDQHSPHSAISAPSPPQVHSTVNAQQQLPPACGARQLSKLKRFLTTLIQFGTDISNEIGERVRSLVLGLVNNHLSIEEFHSKLQEATNFPLRPFVIPFLKTNLPLLQRELLHCARMARQTPSQYLQHNEHVIFDPTRPPPLDPTRPPPLDSSCSDISNTDINENGKRLRSPDRSKENGLESQSENLNQQAKRAHTISPTRISPGCARISPASSHVSPGSTRTSPGSTSTFAGAPVTLASLRLEDMSAQRDTLASLRLEDMSAHRDMRDRTQRTDRERPDRQIGYPRGEQYDVHLERVEDEWKHLENMLHCVMDMVGRCRQALTALQERTRREREELARWVRHQNGVDPEVKKRADYMTESLRHTEDRVTEVRRRAVHVFPEDAVNEVKRQAMIELQKAVAAAESKANELVAAERAKMELQLTEATKQARDDVMALLNRQHENSESCWNCGRKANETCSGCNTARYCGSFCQHKDWENHHRACGQAFANQEQALSANHGQAPSANQGEGISSNQGPLLSANQRPPRTQADDNAKLPLADGDKNKLASSTDKTNVNTEHNGQSIENVKSESVSENREKEDSLTSNPTVCNPRSSPDVTSPGSSHPQQNSSGSVQT